MKKLAMSNEQLAIHYQIAISNAAAAAAELNRQSSIANASQIVNCKLGIAPEGSF